jgi:ATP-dependent DNA helicase RecG
VSEGVSNRVPNGVSDTAKAIYSHIQADPNISRNELVNLTGISLKNVQKHINRLKELGLIRRIGSTRFGYWEIIE